MRQHHFRVHPAVPGDEPPPQIVPADDWHTIADYVRTVARAAYSHGYTAGMRNARDYYAHELREQEIAVYVATFDVETVKMHHPITSDLAANRADTGQ